MSSAKGSAEHTEDVRGSVDKAYDDIRLRAADCFVEAGKADKFLKLLDEVQNAQIIEDFVKDPEIPILFIFYRSDKVVASLSFPTNLKKKALYFMKDKHVKDSLSPATLRDHVIINEVTEAALKNLALIAQEVYYPLLANPSNREGWSGPTSKDIMLKLSGFLANVTMTVGQSNGQTILPPPPPEAFDEDNVPEKEREHLLDTSVVLWAERMRYVIDLSPESLQDAGQHPDPSAEVEFWLAKAQDLKSLEVQLASPTMQTVLTTLTDLKSPFAAQLQSLSADVQRAYGQAAENYRYLRALQSHFRRLRNTMDFPSVVEVMQPMMHCVLLVWKTSPTFNTNERLTVLIQEICNSLIAEAEKYVNGEIVFRQIEDENVSDAVHLLRSTVVVCQKFKNIFFKYQARAAKLLPPAQAWNVSSEQIFSRLDAYLERLGDILDFCKIVQEFNKLEKIYVGGTKGNHLTNMVRQIFADFVSAVREFQKAPYDILDVTQTRFDDDFYQYRCKVKELDGRLAAVLSSAFDDSATMTAQFKLLDSFEGLIERPIIKDELDRKHSQMLKAYLADLLKVQEHFHSYRNTPFIDSNMPPVAGAIGWCRSLRNRISEPRDKLQPIIDGNDSEESKEVVHCYEATLRQLLAYETAQVDAWTAAIDSVQEKLRQSVLAREKDGRRLRVNFDDSLVRLLREVKYLRGFGIQVSQQATQIYDKSQTFRQQIGSLTQIVNMYNEIVETLLPYEQPLLEKDVAHMNEVLDKGLTEYHWKIPAVPDFIAEAMTTVKQVYGTVKVMKNNFAFIEKVIMDFAKEPLVERKNKSISPADFEDNLKKLWESRYKVLQQHHESFTAKVDETLKTLNANKTSGHWRKYMEAVQEKIRDGLVQAIINSIKFLTEQIDPVAIEKNGIPPMLEIKLGFYANDVLYNADESSSSATNAAGAAAGAGAGGAGANGPAGLMLGPAGGFGMFGLGLDDKGSRKTKRDVWLYLTDWVEGFFEIGNKISRADNSTYIGELKKTDSIGRSLGVLKKYSEHNQRECEGLRQEYMRFDHLYKLDRNAEFNKFLQAAIASAKRDANSESKTAAAAASSAAQTSASADAEESLDDDEFSSDSSDVALPLDKFEEKIQFYKNLQAEISEKKNVIEIGFLKINAQPIKQALVTLCSRWISTYTSYLYNEVTRKLTMVETLMRQVSDGVQVDVNDGDSEALKRVLGFIHQVRSKERSTSKMFEPLRAAVAVLKKHGKSLDEQELKLLSEAPMKWDSVVNMVYKVKEKVNVLQNDEVDKIKFKVKNFNLELLEFREQFKDEAPFHYEVEVQEAYDDIYTFHRRINQMEIKAAKLTDLEKVFELSVSKHLEIKKNRAENKLLKQIWDMVSIVRTTFADWRKTMWNKIDTDVLISESNKLKRQIAMLPAEVRAWPVYEGLVLEVKNLSVVLPMVDLLHSPFMQDRHWDQIKKATRKEFNKDDNFCLADLLELELHKYVDDVEYIVELAKKEANIASQLEKIDIKWASLKLDFGVHPKKADLQVIHRPDEILATLEEHMSQLQNMQGQGKYVEHFIDRVSMWQRRLNVVETVLNDWLDVQKKWGSLEPIYMGSMDIKSQLPEDSNRFDEIDATWRDLMLHAAETPMVLNACQAPGRAEMLATLKVGLEQCEKSLYQYLEMKRKSFPRFYFIANAALLDMLSSGDDPHAVQRHISDCFDNLHHLEFKPLKDVDAAKADGESADAGDSNAEVTGRARLSSTAALAAPKEHLQTQGAPVTDPDEPLSRIAIGMHSKDGDEYVPLHEEFLCSGAVENWLTRLVQRMRDTLKDILARAKFTADHWEIEKPRHRWLFDYPAQIALTASQIIWTEEVGSQFDAFQDGNEQAMKEYAKVLATRLEELISLVLGELDPCDRIKIMTLITVDVHNRDVVAKLIDQKVTEPNSFAWQSQMRYTWEDQDISAENAEGKSGDDLKECYIKVADGAWSYSYEYVGNTGRLVITPLTDRCYITLTQALRLIMGGAPAGPAGTGKTETTKDLGRAFGLPVYVFNCFPEVDTRVLTNHGMLFLTEIENLLESNTDVRYACLDKRTQRIVYRPGRIVFRKEPDTILNFTSEAESVRWSANADMSGACEDQPRDRSNRLSLRVTAGHEMYVQTGTLDRNGTTDWLLETPKVKSTLAPFRKVSAKDLVGVDRGSLRMLSVATGGFEPSDQASTALADGLARMGITTAEQTDAFLELYGFWLGDGTMTYSGTVGRADDVVFQQRKKCDVEFIDAALRVLDLPADQVRRFACSRGMTSWTVVDTRWSEFFHTNHGHKYEGGCERMDADYVPRIKSAKGLPRWATSVLSKAQARVLLAGLQRADGSCASGENVIFTSCPRFRDELVVLALHAGYTAYFDVRATTDAWKVCFAEPITVAAKQGAWPSMKSSDVTATEASAADGRLWCVDVEHEDHLIFAQRAERNEEGVVTKAGRIVVTGNCSEQMNVQSMSAIFKGLSQTGAWGCFDEFNRIQIEVLSVISTQVATVLNAIRAKREEFDFMGDICRLVPSVGMFITMNPGYAGRTELPENLKALFRSCAMVVPDMDLICENMLMSEGFLQAQRLTKKFVTLYSLCSDLLSKQRHYDWGLRACKAVLRVAGGLKRAEPEVDENRILMRALRDFNFPKIVDEDKVIFKQLIDDLFPGIGNTPRKFDKALEATVQRVAVHKRRLQAEEKFDRKCIELSELLVIRHSVFIVGPASAGKSEIWKTLADAFNDMGKETIYDVINPKAVLNRELYGWLSKTDWHDGILSTLMRNMSHSEGPYTEQQFYKWVVLDGDIDPEWIETMNTVMDDNKMLTLVSNERIPLTKSMRMMFEISNLDNATPATVSRAGIIYINASDIGSKPFLDSWVEQRTNDKEKSSLLALLNRYTTPESLNEIMATFQRVIPISEINMIRTMCYLLEGLLESLAETAKENKKKNIVVSPAQEKETFEATFVFACIWAFGSAVYSDKVKNSRSEFSEWWKRVFTTIKFPGSVYDYFVDDKGKLALWSSIIENYVPPPDAYLVTQVFVPTVESVRMRFLLDLLVDKQRPALLVGSAGTGKTKLMMEYLRGLRSRDERKVFAAVNINYYTDAKALQRIFESHIEKRAGRVFGPLGNKKLIYFIDDLNMSQVDVYGTQSTIQLIKQQMDYGFWYDTVRLEKKEIHDVQYLACMNPTAGSFVVSDRLQGQFATFAIMMPEMSELKTIYSTVMQCHFSDFTLAQEREVVEMCEPLVKATIDLYDSVATKFLPSTKKFHYQFNLRDLSAVFQGLSMSAPRAGYTAQMMVQLWQHECARVFSDRLVDPKDTQTYDTLVDSRIRDNFRKYLPADVGGLSGHELVQPIFASFVHNPEAGTYLPVEDMGHLKQVLSYKLEEYNTNNAAMNLELFNIAMQHISRIVRIIENPQGNALLVGVGGSGKQSLCRLAAHISGYAVVQLSVSQEYTLHDLRLDLQELYRKAGVKRIPLLFMLTDTQILDDRWLSMINDLLCSGNIPGLFNDEDMDGILAAVRNEAKAKGVVDSREAMTEFFISQVRANLHVVLCFSPVGEVFRVRCRKFPGIINCTVIDWFHAWPHEALVSVAKRFMQDMELGGPDALSAIADHMARVHLSVDDFSTQYRTVQRRYNYTTPKSFLELISFYRMLLGEKRSELLRQVARLQKGIQTLNNTHADVERLKDMLAEKLVVVGEKKEATEAIIAKISVERKKVEEQQAIAAVEAGKAKAVAEVAAKISEECRRDLDAAMPIKEAALEAVKVLKSAQLTVLKNLANPAVDITFVTQAVMIMRNFPGKRTWANAKIMMKDVNRFKLELEQFDATSITEDTLKKLQPILSKDFFNPEGMATKSEAAANLCTWVVNIVRYNEVWKMIKPKMDAEANAKGEYEAAAAKLQLVEDKVAAMQAKLKAVTDQFERKLAEKNQVEQEARDCQDRLALAKRLVDGLADENTRWNKSVGDMQEKSRTLVGDVMLAASFVSYLGAFDQEFRVNLWEKTWMPDLVEKQIPLTARVDPLRVLANDSDFAKWKNEGLAADRSSLENGAIITQCARWPLMIDPQLQGIQWIRGRVKNLITTQQNQPGYINTVVQAITNGHALLLDNCPEDLDATLDPILSRSVIQRGSRKFIKIGADEVQFNDNFQLFLQCKLANPHYRPEIFAQCTLINFIVTEAGLEDQLLAIVVDKEQPELEEKRTALVRAINEYMVSLTDLETEILTRLMDAPPDILSDVGLIEGLEKTKSASMEIELKVSQSRDQEISINAARNEFRSVAAEGSWLYFLLIQLNAVDHMYQFSLNAFVSFFRKAMNRTPKVESTLERVRLLRENIRITVFTWVTRGLFERHKLIFSSQLCFKLMMKGALREPYNPEYYDFLVRAPRKTSNTEKCLDWLTKPSWEAILHLSSLEGFEKLSKEMANSPNRFKEWYNKARPESAPLPLEWRKLDENSPFMKLLIVRALRPDRMITAMENYVSSALPDGKSFIECDAGKSFLEVLSSSLDDSSARNPIFFILSPGADPIASVEILAKRQGMYDHRFHRVALGQGQDIVASQRLMAGAREGHWVVLENIHLMPLWLKSLEKVFDDLDQTGTHPDFRIFLSAEPAEWIPIGILERSLKLTSEPPQGLKQNIKRAFATFDKEHFDYVDSKVKSILFGLCHFHSVIIERCKFGPKGWNRVYPFNTGDLLNSATVIQTYLEAANANDAVPWKDLRYMVGEILYGGHITDDWDRLLCVTYLKFYLRDELLDEMELYPFIDANSEDHFRSPPILPYEQYFDYIDSQLVNESPIAFGMHPNEDIAVMTSQATVLFNRVLELQPPTSASGSTSSEAMSVQARVQIVLDGILERVKGISFHLDDIAQQIVDERGPFQNVFLQECDRMNILVREINRSLRELSQGLAGELQMSERMEQLQNSLFFNRIPRSWEVLAYPSERGLLSWVENLVDRASQLQDWTEEPSQVPMVVSIDKLFNPQSFLTAIMQKTAQKQKLELDKLVIQTEVTRKTPDEVDSRSRDGAYITGLYLEGARFNVNSGVLEEAAPREMFFAMPVISCKAILVDKMERSGFYRCPVYKTEKRGPTYVFTANLRTKLPAEKWVLAGTTLVMETAE